MPASFESIQSFGNTLMILGGVMLVLALIWFPFEFNYKKKHGPLPSNLRQMFSISICISSVLLTFTIKTLWFSEARRPSFGNSFTSQSYSGTRRTQQLTAEQEARINEDKEFAEFRRAEREAYDRQNAKAAQDRQIALEARVREKARQAEAERLAWEASKQRHQNRSQQSKAMHEMRSTDVFAPLPNASPRQAALSQRIVAANEELQKLKAQKQQHDGTRMQAFDAIREVSRSTPIDRARMKELETQIREASEASSALSSSIREERSKLNELLTEQSQLAE